MAKFLERTLEDIIYHHYESCYKRGLDISEHEEPFIRQLNIPCYGIIDMIRFAYEPYSNTIHIQILELKKDKIDYNTLGQISRYQTAIRDILEYHFPEKELDFELILIGNKIDNSSDFVFAYNNIDGLSIFFYEYGLDGIVFKRTKKTWCKANFDVKNFDHPFIEPLGVGIDASDYYLKKHFEQRQQDRILNSLPIVITSEGVLLNPNHLEIKNDDEYPF